MTPYKGYFCVSGLSDNNKLLEALEYELKQTGHTIAKLDTFTCGTISQFFYLSAAFFIHREDVIEDLLMSVSSVLDTPVMFFGKPAYDEEDFSKLIASSSVREPNDILKRAGIHLRRVTNHQFEICNLDTYYFVFPDSNASFMLREYFKMQFMLSLQQ